MSSAWRASPPPDLALPEPLIGAFAGFLRDRFPKARPHRIESAVAELSELFTAARSELPRSYLNQPPIRSAYLAYFHPLQVLRGLGALGEVLERAAGRGLLADPKERPFRVADLGAGLGAMTQAYAALRAQSARRDEAWEAVLVDHQRSAVRDGADLTERAAVALGGAVPQVRAVAADLSAWMQGAKDRRQRFDLVLMGGVWNERRGDWAPLLARLLDVVSPDGLVVIVEPAIAPVSRRLMELRETFLSRTTTVAPCTHGAECPLLPLTRDWCFTVRPASFPQTVARLARILHHQAREVRYVLWAFTPSSEAAPFPEGTARVVTDAMDGEHVLCTDGRRERVPVLGCQRGALARR